MDKEDQDLKALSTIAGKPKKQEKFPAFKSPLIEKMAENYAVQSQSSSSSGFDSDVGDFNNDKDWLILTENEKWELKEKSK